MTHTTYDSTRKMIMTKEHEENITRNMAQTKSRPKTRQSTKPIQDQNLNQKQTKTETGQGPRPRSDQSHDQDQYQTKTEKQKILKPKSNANKNEVHKSSNLEAQLSLFLASLNTISKIVIIGFI